MIQKTSLVVPFGDDALGDGGDIRIELEEHIPYAGWQIMLRVWANGDYPSYRTSRGEVGYVESGIKEIRGETVLFRNADTATLSYPIGKVSGVRIYRSGHTFDENGKAIGVSVTWDADKRQLVADKKFYGVVIVDYQAPYSIIGYRYEQEITPAGTGSASHLLRVTNIPGWVYAFIVRDGVKPRFGAFEIPDIETTYDFGGVTDRLELYREVSYGILTPDGMYEKSTGDGNDFLPAEFEDSYTIENKRTHTVGYLDKNGRKYEQSYDVPLGIPFETERASAVNQGYPIKSWEFSTYSEPSQTYDDSSLLTTATMEIDLKKQEVGA